ncbi:hypothetical protein JOQ06_021316, partial [Pogonophryne albipinna]
RHPNALERLNGSKSLQPGEVVPIMVMGTPDEVSPSALAPAKVTAVSATERAPDATPPSVLGAWPGGRRGEERRN